MSDALFAVARADGRKPKGLAPVNSCAAMTDPTAQLLAGYSVEVTSRDHRSLASARDCLDAGTEVFVVALPNDGSELLVAAATLLPRWSASAAFTPSPLWN